MFKTYLPILNTQWEEAIYLNSYLCDGKRRAVNFLQHKSNANTNTYREGASEKERERGVKEDN